jgi:hypothetical protein
MSLRHLQRWAPTAFDRATVSAEGRPVDHVESCGTMVANHPPDLVAVPLETSSENRQLPSLDLVLRALSRVVRD